jgi:hypothetical protein
MILGGVASGGASTSSSNGNPSSSSLPPALPVTGVAVTGDVFFDGLRRGLYTIECTSNTGATSPTITSGARTWRVERSIDEFEQLSSLLRYRWPSLVGASGLEAPAALVMPTNVGEPGPDNVAYIAAAQRTLTTWLSMLLTISPVTRCEMFIDFLREGIPRSGSGDLSVELELLAMTPRGHLPGAAGADTVTTTTGGGGIIAGGGSTDSGASEEKRKPVRLRDFVLLKVIGKGSFGKVMMVRKLDTSNIYAMKVLQKGTSSFLSLLDNCPLIMKMN